VYLFAKTIRISALTLSLGNFETHDKKNTKTVSFGRTWVFKDTFSLSGLANKVCSASLSKKKEPESGSF
tara:strand:- start:67 stop:273 length:207 start_codon:yes stop_codon:yes gene_type:complete